MRWQWLFWVGVWVATLPTCLALWQTTIGHVVKDEALLVDFAPAEGQYNFGSYWVVLWFVSQSRNLTGGRRCDGLSGKRLRSFNVTAEWPVTRQKFENIGTAGSFCIRVTPLTLDEGGDCRNGCRTVSSDVFYLQGNNNTPASDCENWGVDITMNFRTPERTAVVSYEVHENISDCLHSFRIDLWYKARYRCDGITGFRLMFTIAPGSKSVVAFHNLEPGNYCVRVTPYNWTCHGQCLPRYSLIQTLVPFLSDGVPEVPLPAVKKSESSPAVWQYPVILCAILLGLSAFVFAIYLKKWRHRLNIKIRVANQVELKEQKPKCDFPEELVALYCHGSKLEEEGALLLADFLFQCCGLRVCTAVGDLHLIAINPEEWVLQKLSSGKILIIESEGAVARERPSLDRQSSSDGLLDKLFENCLAYLRSKDSLIDYKRIAVVRFNKPSNGTLQMVVPSVRYELPGHLPDLYAWLADVGSVHHLPRHPLRDWELKPSYLQLCDFCSRA